MGDASAGGRETENLSFAVELAPRGTGAGVRYQAALHPESSWNCRKNAAVREAVFGALTPAIDPYAPNHEHEGVCFVARRNANGEGSRPRKRPDGRWEGRYWIETPDGRKRRSVYGAYELYELTDEEIAIVEGQV